MTDKKPVPPSLAEFALEQLAEAGEQAAIDLTVQNVEILRKENERLRAELSVLKAGQGEAVAYRWAWKECREDDGWTYRESPPFDPTTVVVQALYLAPPASADAVSVVLFKTLSDAVSELSSLNSYAREVANEDDDEESQEVCDSTDESIEHMQAVLNKYRALLAQSQGVKP